jgi:hypothetical protein
MCVSVCGREREREHNIIRHNTRQNIDDYFDMNSTITSKGIDNNREKEHNNQRKEKKKRHTYRM